MSKYAFFYDPEVNQMAIIKENEEGKTDEAVYGSLKDIYELLLRPIAQEEVKEEINENQVFHPSHYNKPDRKECWEEMIDVFGPEATVIFDCLSAFKYNYRAGEKEGNPEKQDKAKITNYLYHASKLIIEMENEPYKDLLTVLFAQSILNVTKDYIEGEHDDKCC